MLGVTSNTWSTEDALNTLPNDLQQLIASAFRNMKSNSAHHLAPFHRHQLYRTLRELAPAVRSMNEDPSRDVSPVQGWLAILAAERVLPIFEGATFGLDDMDDEFFQLPRELIKIAREFMIRPFNLAEVREEASEAHQWLENWLGEAEYDPNAVPLNAILAGSSAQRALSEVVGWDYFDLMSAEDKQRWLRAPAEQLTDEQLVFGDSDAAGRAAVAYACSPTSVRCEPERIEEFWTWWLTKALPKAWELASRKSYKYD